LPKYKVVAANADTIPVCVLATRKLNKHTISDKIDYLKVKELTAANALPFVDKEIIVTTTNRDIVPWDIIGPLEMDESVADIEGVQVRYYILSVADGIINVCTLTVHDEEGRLNYLQVRKLDPEAAKIFIGEEIMVATLSHEILPRDIVVKSLEIEPEVPEL